MRSLFTILLLLFLSTITVAQQFAIDSTRFVGGDASCGYWALFGATATRDGGALLVGYTDCFAGGGNIPASPPDNPANSTPSNVIIGKLDCNLNVSWVKVYGGTWDDIATGAVQTSDGGYAVLAYTGSNDRDVSGNHGDEDLWLIRLDSAGNLLWQKCYGSAYDEQSISLSRTADNGFILLGVSNGVGDDVPLHYGNEFNYNWFVVKTDSIGNMQWSRTIGGTGGEDENGCIVPVGNSYYLVSSTWSTDYDCTDTAWCAGNAQATQDNYYVFKLDSAGNTLWDSSYGGGGADMAYSAIWDSRDSTIVINGFTTSNNYMVSGNHGSGDMWVIKINANGTLLWQKCLGGPQSEQGSSIIATPFGYIAYGSTQTGNIGKENAWLFALDDTGHTLTNLQFGGTGHDYEYSVIPFNNGYAATGCSNSVSFTAGTNIGFLPGAITDAFATYFSYWPLSIPAISSISKEMSLYPNPTNDMVRVDLPGGDGNVIIINCIGNTIKEIACKNESYIDINTAGWANGLYIVRWQGEDGTVLIKKLIKN